MDKCENGVCDLNHPPCSKCAFYFVREGDNSVDLNARAAVEGLDVQLAEYFEEIRYEDHP